MSKYVNIRSLSFDTSFLLKDNYYVDLAIKKISFSKIPCFITSTVLSELEQLKIWGRISLNDWKKATIKIKKLNAEIIDFKNRLLSNSFGKICIQSMKEHHGIEAKNIKNDCNILVTNLKKGVDFLLSEDYHFTSKVTLDVVEDIKHIACKEFSQMCDSSLYMIDTKTFLNAFNNEQMDIEIIESNMKNIKKSEKNL
jgi:rRNA-processing protein FCF1